MKKDAGFTLIEVVLSLIIVGLMAAIAGMGIVTGTKGYMMARENAHIAQKAQLAMARMSRDLMELTDIPIKDPSWIIFDRPTEASNPIPIERLAFALDANENAVKLYRLPLNAAAISGDGDILVDNVQSFNINYYESDGSGTVTAGWDTLSDTIEELSAIRVELVLTRDQAISSNTMAVSTTIHPRNTNNFGGAPSNTTPPTANQYDCFIATAAYGDPNHPMVRLLRHFRDTHLETWWGGQQLVATYYAIGPHLAGLIKDHPQARCVARWMLTPAVGLTHLLVVCPWCVPLLFLLSGLAARRMTQFASTAAKKRHRLSTSGGNVLVGLVVTMLIFAALAAGMVSMTSTSATNQVVSNTTARAYYLAESGFRFAASRYLNAPDTNLPTGTVEDDRNLILENTLHCPTDSDVFTMSDPNERFRVLIYPFYYTTAVSYSAGATNVIRTKFSGEQPADFIVPSSGYLKIGDTVQSYSNYNSGTGEFTLTNPIVETIDSNMIIHPVGRPSGSTTLNRNDDLTLTDASFFPLLNGKISINGTAYAYQKRNGNTLATLTDAEYPDRAFSEAVDPTTDIVLDPFIQVRSIGMIGAGADVASREVTYNVPLPGSPMRETVEFYESFEDTSNWNLNVAGTQAQEFIDGDFALRVTGTDLQSGTGAYTSMATLNWTTTNLNLVSAHSSTGGFLSYDAQVKIGFVNFPDTPGDWTILSNPAPDGYPKYYEAGILFRVNQDNDFYGLSFMRGSTNLDPRPDDIFSGIVPDDQIPMIVLWQQDSFHSNARWIAYNELGVVFTDDMETGDSLWNPEFPWNRVTRTGHTGDSTTVWEMRSDVVGPNIERSLVSETIDLSSASSATLTFWQLAGLSLNDAFGYVDVSVDGGSSWITDLVNFTGIDANWSKVTVDLSSYVPSGQIRIRFRLDTGPFPAGDDWRIDDVTVYRDFPLNQATLLVRILEAVPISFTSGGTTPIESNDTVFQANGARAVVISNPTLSAGSWAGGDAEGTILVNNLSTTDFTTSLPLDVLGKANNLATVTGFDRTAKFNVIRGYYGNLLGEGTPNSDPYDDQRGENTRGTVNWPVADVNQWAPINDNFTLVRWKPFFNSAVSTASFLPSVDEYQVIIASNEPDLLTPESILASRPEFGLHASGQGAQEIYFDDFAVLLETASNIGFRAPIQQ